MNITITPQGVRIWDTLYPFGTVLLTVNGLGTKVSVLHTYTLQHLVGEFVPFGSVINESTGLGYATLAELQTAFTSQTGNPIISGNG